MECNVVQHNAMHVICSIHVQYTCTCIILAFLLQFGWTALHHASRNGNVDICKLLLRYQAKVELRNEVILIINNINSSDDREVSKLCVPYMYMGVYM